MEEGGSSQSAYDGQFEFVEFTFEKNPSSTMADADILAAIARDYDEYYSLTIDQKASSITLIDINNVEYRGSFSEPRLTETLGTGVYTIYVNLTSKYDPNDGRTVNLSERLTIFTNGTYAEVQLEINSDYAAYAYFMNIYA